MIKKLLITFFILLLLIGGGTAGWLYWAVVLEPGDLISRENIKKILGKESPVYYSDGVSPLGVFFADAHRQYVSYDEIPINFVNALVAAEDNRFFSHFGFDVIGIMRAAMKNIEARRVVQGGSTLTQQTAKNLFKRKNRSLEEKLKELLFALRLEYHYSKEQIFEFYANQFYVSGNGLGLGVAARYYFDKKVEDLTLVESAYIAGSVKRPNYYNPFIKKSSESAQKAIDRGKVRVEYVLKNMKSLGMIGESAYREAIEEGVTFNKGSVGYALDYVMEMVTDAVGSERVTKTLSARGIENVATSGIRIITSVDKDLQSKTLYSLRKQLSLLDVRLRGYEREEVQAELADTKYRGDPHLLERSFHFGEVRSIFKNGDDIAIDVYLNRKHGNGVIDRQGIKALVDARVKWQEHRWSESDEEDVDRLLEQIQEGDRVWVSVRSYKEGEKPLFDLEKFPRVKGGAIVMQEGKIKSVAGGVENRFFNRAVYGKRTMGSSYKPFVFTAALQLGWNTADLIPNRRDIFVYQNQPYFPRPDHAIDNEQVSISWAAVRSENLASVWLAKNLCDKLTKSELIEVASHLGLAPRIVDGEQEPYRLFRGRIRDRYGIQMNQDALRQAAYQKTIDTIQPDLIFEGLEKEYTTLKDLHYGLGFRKFKEEVKNKLLGKEALSSSEIKEYELRLKLLSRNFLELSRLRVDLDRYLADPLATEDQTMIFGFDDPKEYEEKPKLYYNRLAGEYLFGYPDYLPEGSVLVNGYDLQRYLDAVSPQEKEKFVDSIKLGGYLTVSAYEFTNRLVDREYQQMRKMLPYSMDILRYVDDYLALVSLHYLIAFGEKLGIESKLEPVLSFPLGSNVVTLLETTRVYEALVTGKTHLFREQSGEINNTLAIIDRIEDADGSLLYKPEVETSSVVDEKTTMMISHALENTVKFGTGRFADRNIKLSGNVTESGGGEALSVSVPLLGKTGTANRYTNASFFGYLPVINKDGNGVSISGGFAVGVYAGYDDNKPMRKKTTRITGAAGALPTWTDLVNALLNEKEFAATIDPVDLSFYGLILERNRLGQRNLSVNVEGGGVLTVPIEEVDEHNRYQPSIMTFGTFNENGEFAPERNFSPFWRVGEASQNTPGLPFTETDLELTVGIE